MVFKYLPYSLRLERGTVTLFLPMLQIILRSANGTELSTAALIDSGATTTFIPYELNEILSFPRIKGGETIAAGGRFETDIVQIRKFSIMRGKNTVTTFYSIQAHVPKKPDQIPYVVLGRDYIFKRFEITFCERRKKFILKPI